MRSRICFWDIETSFSVMATFGLFNENIPYDNILEDWYIICGSWKFLNEDKVHSVSLLGDKKRFDITPRDDFFVVKKLHEMLQNVDILIHHNGDKFDVKKLMARMIYHGLPPLPFFETIDTLKVARKYFKFTSNRLDYIAQYLDVGEKIATSKGLWLKALAGDPEAVEEMVTYNKVDVRILEGVYLKLRPYMKNHPNLLKYDGKQREICSKCDSPHIQYRGTSISESGKFRRFQCQECGKWGQSTKVMVRV